MNKQEKEMTLLQTQPIGFTIEFSGYILAKDITAEHKRIMGFFNLQTLNVNQLEELVSLRRDYSVSQVNSDLEKGIFVTILG